MAEPADNAHSVNLVVTGLGYAIRHIVTVPADAVAPMHWMTDFPGVRTPLVARCGVQIRSIRPAVVVMLPTVSVSCKWCERFTAGETLDNAAYHLEATP